MKYRSSENIDQAIETFQRAVTRLTKKQQSLEETGNLQFMIEAMGVIKNTFSNIHLDNWASSLRRDTKEDNSYD